VLHEKTLLRVIVESKTIVFHPMIFGDVRGKMCKRT